MPASRSKRSARSRPTSGNAASLYRLAFEASVGACLIGPGGRIELFNSEFLRIHGLSRRAVRVGMQMHQVMEKAVASDVLGVSAAAEYGRAGDVRFARKRPFKLPLQLRGHFLSVQHTLLSRGRWLVVYHDVSANRQLKSELHTQVQRLNYALANMSHGLCLFGPDERLIMRNEQYCQIYGIDPAVVRPGVTHREIIEHWVASGNQPGLTAEQLYQNRMREIRSDSAKIGRLTRKDGRIVEALSRVTAEGGWVSTNVDITDRCEAEARILHMTRHDVLTDLPNRLLLRERLDAALREMQQGGHAAVLLLDLDRFKEINDTLGHFVGDELLKGVAERLRGCVGTTATVARLGGDEFAVVDRVISPFTEATAIATTIQEALSAPFHLKQTQAVVGSSVGIAIAPNDGVTCDELLKNADLALYHAKAQGRGSFCVFQPHMDRLMQSRRELERDLHAALPNGQFELYYQPVMCLRRGIVSGFEALLRWHHPAHGLVLPGEFIPLAEETGLIQSIGAWVLKTACAEAANWPSHVRVAVNISPVQFKDAQLMPTIVTALAASGLSLSRLELEITESMMMQEGEAVLAALRQLHVMGVQIALDDFGTGCSSLSVLRKFAFDKIKIDRSFVSEIGTAEESRAIVRSVALLASSLGKATTAEGVETKEVLDMVRTNGCSEAQGYYFGRPAPASEIPALLKTRLGAVRAA